MVDAKTRIEELEKALTTVRTTAPEGTEELAQGEDKFTLPFYASAKYNYSGWEKSAGGWIRQPTTWNALFGSIAPQLLQEAEEGALHKGIQNFLLGEFLDELVEAVLKGAKKKGHDISHADLRGAAAEVHNDNFGTILVQLMALGLIHRSEKKRSVNDTGTYWALTPYGETRTIQLRALKKSAAETLGREEEDEPQTSDTAEGEH